MPSSVIRRFSYHDNERTLDVTFISGRRYHYLDVPPTLYQQMREAFSKGEFFNQNIRDRFPYQRVGGDVV